MQIGAEALVALVALVVSIVALVKGERMQRARQKSQSEHEALQSNVSLLVDVWSRIGSKPSLLRFHGINMVERACTWLIQQRFKGVGMRLRPFSSHCKSFCSPVVSF